VVGGWAGQSQRQKKKKQGQIPKIRHDFCVKGLVSGMMFLNSPHQETPKNAIKQTKNRGNTHALFPPRLFYKIFRLRPFTKIFVWVCGYFELPLSRNAQGGSADIISAVVGGYPPASGSRSTSRP
jgi:hypothetical protein